MMNNEELFATQIAKAVLTTAGEEIQVVILDELINNPGSSIADQIESAKKTEKSTGDFGMEILGPFLISVLIEAGRTLWKAYIKKIGDKTADEIADFTVDKIKGLARSIWQGENDEIKISDFENYLKIAAVAQGLSEEQTIRLVAAVKSVNMKNNL
jgi:hypothetical protein